MLATMVVGCILLIKEAAPFLSTSRSSADPESIPVTVELRTAQQANRQAVGPGAGAATPSTGAAASSVGAAASHGTAAAGAKTPFIALGIVSNVMWQNSFERRRWLRETMFTYSNVGHSMEVKFIVALLQTDLSPIPSDMRADLDAEEAAHGDLLMLSAVPERKSPCLKTMAWYKWAVHAYPTAAFIAKTDDDAYVHTLKLEHNMRRFVGQPRIYIGSTLWGSYITKTFEVCIYIQRYIDV